MKSHRIAWLLIFGMLFLRLPFLTTILIFSRPAWLWPIYDVGTFLLIAIFILWERENLTQFHLDTLAIWIIFLAKLNQYPLVDLWRIKSILLHPRAIDRTFFPRPEFVNILIWLITIGFILALVLIRPQLPKFHWKSLGWIGIGSLVGVGMSIMLAYPTALDYLSYDPSHVFRPDYGDLWAAWDQVFYQLGIAATTEEPLFRGFLWGALRRMGLKDIWILFFQAILFILGHIYYFPKLPYAFFVTLPIGSLLLGGLVWKSRTISTSMAAHSVGNALGYYTGMFVAFLIKT